MEEEINELGKKTKSQRNRKQKYRKNLLKSLRRPLKKIQENNDISRGPGHIRTVLQMLKRYQGNITVVFQ